MKALIIAITICMAPVQQPEPVTLTDWGYSIILRATDGIISRIHNTQASTDSWIHA